MSTSDTNLCWSCQADVEREDCIWIDAERFIPCCRDCWSQIPAGQRLVIAMKVREAPQVESTLAAVRRLARRHLEAKDGTDPEFDWLLGGS